MIPKLISINSPDRILNMFQDSVKKVFSSFDKNPIIDGIILQNIAINSGLNEINHMLGRKLIGWVIIRKRGFADIDDSQDGNLNNEKTLVLNSTADTNIDLYVF